MSQPPEYPGNPADPHGGGPGGAAELFRVDAQLLAHQRVEGGAAIGEDLVGQGLGLRLGEALGLVDQDQLFLLKLGRLLQLAPENSQRSRRFATGKLLWPNAS